jgi:hypothetical protein
VNAFYHVNRAVGIVFVLGLLGFGGYKFFAWRDEMAQEAVRRLHHRIQQISDETAKEFQSHAAFPDVQQPEEWQNVHRQDWQGN